MTRKPTIRRGSLPGYTSRYWMEGDQLIIELGRGLDEVAQQRVVSEAMRTYGMEPRRKRRMLPLPVFLGGAGARLGAAARDHPVLATGVAAGLLAVGIAGTAAVSQLDDDHAHPPAIAGPSASRPPSPGTAPSPSVSRTPGRPGPTGSPSSGTPPGSRPPGAPPPSSSPSGAPPPRPTPTAPPSRPPPSSSPSPPPTPPPTPAPPRQACLIGLDLPPLLTLRLLCGD